MTVLRSIRFDFVENGIEAAVTASVDDNTATYTAAFGKGWTVRSILEREIAGHGYVGRWHVTPQ